MKEAGVSASEEWIEFRITEQGADTVDWLGATSEPRASSGKFCQSLLDQTSISHESVP